MARLMKERGLVGEMPKRWRHPSAAPSDGVSAPNTLDRGFNVSAPNRVWASDITYIRTWEGWLYLAVVIDLFSRRVVGWALGFTGDLLLAEKKVTWSLAEMLDRALGKGPPLVWPLLVSRVDHDSFAGPAPSPSRRSDAR